MSDPTPTAEESLALALRDALAAALAEHLKRSKSSRDFARRLGLDKSLGWKLWRMTTAPSAAALLRVLPKAHGVRTVLEAVRAGSASAALAEAVDRAAQQLVAVRNEASRATTAGGTARRTSGARPKAAAQLAERFEHDVEATGTSVELRVGAFLLSPDAARERVDVVACAVVSGPRCFRHDVRVPVYSPLVGWRGDSAIRACGTSPAALDGVPGLLPELSTRGLAAAQFADFERRPNSLVRDWAVLPRPGVPETLAFLEVGRGIGNLWAALPNDFGIVSMAITAPTRRAVLDLWVHKSMPMPDVTASCREIQSVIPHPSAPSRELPYPFPDGVLLECRKPSLGASFGDAEEGYRALIDRGAASLAAQRGDFRLLRVAVNHPAFGSSLVADWPLPQRR